MISVILVDDELIALKELRHFLSGYDNIDICGMYSDPLKALEKVEEDEPDAVFLDINMPYINGMEFVAEIRKLNSKTKIIFVTAYDDFAVDAFDIQAFDYILKPFSKDRFKRSMHRLIESCSIKNQNEQKELIWVQCFGNLQVFKNKSKNETMKWRTAKVKELFAYLMYRYGKSNSKYDMIKVLFYYFDEKKALNNLYVTMHYLRKQLDDFGIGNNVISIKDNYTLEIANGICDYLEFNRFLNEHTIVNKDNVLEYEKIIELYKGAYLESDDYLWAIELRENIANKYEEAVLLVADYYYKLEELKKAESLLLKLVSVNSLSEEGNKRLLDIYIVLKDNRLYVKRYKIYEKLVKEEFDIVPELKYIDYYYSIYRKFH